MKVYRNEKLRWVIERENGETIELTWNESNLLYHQMLRESVWSKVELRFPDYDDDNIFREQFGYSRKEIEAAKEDIIEELLPELQDISEDLIYDTIRKFCEISS